MFLRKIDDNGMFVEDVLLDSIPFLTSIKTFSSTDENGNPVPETIIVPVLDDNDNPIPDPHYITVPCPGGFYWPKWDGTQWVEGGAPPEPVTPTPTQDERLSAVEAAISALMGV